MFFIDNIVPNTTFVLCSSNYHSNSPFQVLQVLQNSPCMIKLMQLTLPNLALNTCHPNACPDIRIADPNPSGDPTAIPEHVHFYYLQPLFLTLDSQTLRLIE